VRPWAAGLRRWWRGGVPTFYDPLYRLPMTSLFARTGLDPRRPELSLVWLQAAGAVRAADLRRPPGATWAALLAVHPAEWLDRLAQEDELARIFGVEPWDVVADEVLLSLRAVVGGTVAAADEALRRGGPTLQLAGGFHHAGRARGGGFCAVNDIAVSVFALRSRGFRGRVRVLDLDVHPPDGTADCLAGDAGVWIGSLSGADWGPLPGEVDETVLPAGTGDAVYLDALDALLGRAPPAELTYVIAGGDPLEADALGPLSLSEGGLRSRDRRVAAWLRGGPAVWLPGGAYGAQGWRAFAGTGLAVILDDPTPIPADADPLDLRYVRIASRLRDEELDGGAWITEDDLPGWGGAPARPRLLGFYTGAGLELGLARYGLLTALGRLGYGGFRTEIDRTGVGDRLRLFAEAEGHPGPEQLLVEVVLERRAVDGLPGEWLFVHWLTLRHPRAAFRMERPPLPGQEVPGLGLAREANALLRRIAERLDLAGVAVAPAWFHVAWTARRDMVFADPALQGRFLALGEALSGVPLAEATRWVRDGKITLNGAPYTWEPGVMVIACGAPPAFDPGDPGWRAAVDAERARSRVGLPG